MRKTVKRLLWFLVICAAVNAGSIFDQQSLGPSNTMGVLNQDIQWRQDVTSGISGNLLGFDLYFDSSFGAVIAQDVVVDVLVGGSSVAQRTVHYDGMVETLYFDFSSSGVWFNAGDSWILQVAGSDTSPSYSYYGLSLASDDSLFGGSGYSGELNVHYVSADYTDWYGLYDLRFVEYVDDGAVPEPSALVLFGPALLSLTVLRRKRA